MSDFSVHPGAVDLRLLHSLRNGSSVKSFGDWVANFAGIENLIAVAGFLSPPFYEVRDHIFWDVEIAEIFVSRRPQSPFGDDRVSVERYYNIVNLEEFFTLAGSHSDQDPVFLESLGQVLEHFWKLALRERFPTRRFSFEMGSDALGEDGAFLTFSQREDSEVS